MLFVSYKKVPQGQALIVSSPRRVDVSFTGRLVWAVYNKAEIMDISLKTIEIDRRGAEGLICRDNIRADIKVAFFVRVNKTPEDVIKVAQAIGCVRASDRKVMEELFSAKFSEALKTVGKQLDFVDLYTKREEFRDQIIKVIGRDLNGYFLEDAAIDYLEQTPLDSLDPKNILDAQGIRKITDLTAVEHVRTNEFENNEKKLITKQNVEAREAILELERQQADAEAKQEREIATVRAREQAETLKVQAEERLKSEGARIRADEEVGVQEENKQREVQVAAKNRERVIAVESERVEKERALEVIARERETELRRIAKNKEVEKEKKEIAEVIRERIAVERTVAGEEEKIKELRVVEESRRTKEATIIAAEAEAQEKLVKDIKAAEAADEAAKFRARERVTLADAELEAADKEARAKVRLADGVQAEVAAAGLAQARVKEADAVATEKHGLAEAAVVRQQGLAQAEAVNAKAKAMHELDEAGRGHEEYRLRLDNERTIELSAIEAQRVVAEAKAQILAEALKNAKIDIVGGDAAFLDRLVNAISMGKSVDGFLDHSHAARTVLGDYLSGKASLPEDLKEALAGVVAGRGEAGAVTLGALLGRLLAGKTGEDHARLNQLLQAARKLGVDGFEM